MHEPSIDSVIQINSRWYRIALARVLILKSEQQPPVHDPSPPWNHAENGEFLAVWTDIRTGQGGTCPIPFHRHEAAIDAAIEAIQKLSVRETA